MYSVPFKYSRPYFRFPQSSSSGELTLVVRKSTRGCMSGRSIEHINNKWTTLLCKFCACSSGNSFVSFLSCTINRCSVVYVSEVLCITSRDSSMILCKYLILETIMVPSCDYSISIPSHSCTVPLLTLVPFLNILHIFKPNASTALYSLWDTFRS